MKELALALSIVSLLAWGGTRFVMSIQYDRNIGGYLKRAADSNTVELAAKNLSVAVNYLEENDLQRGYTSVFWRTPDEDIGFWHANLTASLKELRDVPPNATQLERSNVLMKLRETLLDTGQSTTVTAPPGISIFPSNTAFMMWGWLSTILFLVSGGYVIILRISD